MLTITSHAFHEKLQVDNDEIILNGPPGDLQGFVSFTNLHEDPVRIKALPIQQGLKNVAGSLKEGHLRLSFKLNSRESKSENIWHQVDPQTPPGTYEGVILAGGKKRRLKLVVQASIQIEINPVQLAFQGSGPGIKHSVEISITNRGNMPFQIPEVKHVTMVDMDYLCRATALAIRNKGGESYNAMMDEITREIHENMSGWVSVKLREKGEILQPGQSRLLHLSITLPKDADPAKDYSGDIRLWDRQISYVIKSHHEPSTAIKRNGKLK